MSHKIEMKLKIQQIAEKLEGGVTTARILKEYMPKWGLKRRAMERYVALANDIVLRRMKKRDAIIDAVRADIIASEAEKWLKSTLELEARLCAIVTGRIEFDRLIQTKKGVETRKSRPSCAEVIRAIDIILKMRGIYKAADGKIDITDYNVNIMVENEFQKKLIEKLRGNANKDKGN